MKFVEGPLFANIVLADEINRTPPKTQAALLEAIPRSRSRCRLPAGPGVPNVRNGHRRPRPGPARTS
jgi:hypothetical protein